jgi:SAM-dependent methyltransferase
LLTPPVHQYSVDGAFEVATRKVFPEGLQGRSFLDCACNCGGYSFAAKDRGAGEVYGFDIREFWIRQARFLQENRDRESSGMRFDVASFDDLARQDRQYDIGWFSGIFYHLPDPIATLKIVADRTQEVLFLNTACMWFDVTRPEVPELIFRPEGVSPALSGVNGVSWLPSGPLVLSQILKWMGFAETKVYFWQQDAAEAKPGTRRRSQGRIAIAAARDPALLSAMTNLDAPDLRRSGTATGGAGRLDLAAARPTSTMAPARGPRTPTAAGPAVARVAAAKPAAETRPLVWEDDLTSQARDTRPFEVVPPPSTWTADVFAALSESDMIGIADLPLVQLAARDTAPIPLLDDREKYNPDGNLSYWLSGLRDYHAVTRALARHGGRTDRIIDIGAASGRVLRHFAFQSDSPEIWAADVNHRHVRFLTEHMPAHVLPVALPALPHYPVEDNSFDLVMAFSVFTHIDVFETAFLAELRRMLGPGGLAYLTISDEHHWEALRTAATPTTAHLRGVMNRRYPGPSEALEAPLSQSNRWFRYKQTGPYRALAFTPQHQLATVWSRFFRLEEIIPGGHDDQTVVIARKT